MLSQKETGFIRVETLVSTLMPLAVGTAPLPGRQDSLASVAIMLKKKVQDVPSFVETKEMTVGYRGVPLIRDIALRVHRGEIFDAHRPERLG